MKRLTTTIAGLALIGGLTACGDSGSASGDTTVQASRPASSSTSSDSPTGTSTGTADPGAPSRLPEGFPLPDGAAPSGEAVDTPGLLIADYTVPDSRKAWDELVTELPVAGWTVGEKNYSESLRSGTIKATSAKDGTLTVLVLDKDLTLSIKTG
jgi:hypothetical protein